MKQGNHTIDITVSDWDIKRLQDGIKIHWYTRINGILYRIEASGVMK